MAKQNTLSGLLEEQNRLAKPAPRYATVKVIVLVPNVYNGAGHKALPYAEVDSVIEVAGGAYAESLIEDGLVRRYGTAGVEAKARRKKAAD